MHQQSVAEPRNPYLRANSLEELLDWHDMDFVRCAYVTLLGRQPEHEGEAFYTQRLRAGHSKLGILLSLRRSDEGMEHNPGIAGLDRMLRRAAWARRAWVGPLIRLFFGGESDSPMMLKLRRLDNGLELLTADVAAQSRSGAVALPFAETHAVHVKRQPTARLNRQERAIFAQMTRALAE